ncbi:MAG TPA: hypothetical protein VMG12_42050 [Polyangiaceae bacterium]|nr:hypothetical protein [Polyangiaceae bacterium]
MRERYWAGLVPGARVAVAALCCAPAAAAASISVAEPSACGDTAEIVHAIERGVGAPLSEAAPLHFDLSIAREGRGVVARLFTASEPASPRVRRLEAPDCATLAETVAVAIALALGEAEEAELGPSEPHASAASDGIPASPPSTAADAEPGTRGSGVTDAEPSHDARRRVQRESPHVPLEPSLSLWLLGDVGSLPVPSLGVALAADLRWAWLDLVALGSVLFDRNIDLARPNAPDAGATLGLASGGLLACMRSAEAWAPFALRGCVGGELGWLGGEGTGISDPKPGGSVWVAPRVDGTGWLAIAGTPVRLGVWLTAAAPANRDELAIEGVGRAHRPPAIVGRGAIGAELRFE